MPINGPLRRIDGSDLIMAEEVLQAAALLLAPEKTKSRFFLDQLDAVQRLRAQGWSWKQIQSLFKTLKIDVEVSTLRSYLSRYGRRSSERTS